MIQPMKVLLLTDQAESDKSHRGEPELDDMLSGLMGGGIVQNSKN